MKFGQGCLEGYTLKAKLPGKIISNVVISPIIESIDAKIDGKDYNIKYSTIILKDILKPNPQSPIPKPQSPFKVIKKK